MDSLKFNCNEHFDSYESFLSMSEDDSQNTEVLNTYMMESNMWDWDTEKELNGDVAIIPTASYVERQIDNNSPPAKEDYQKIMHEWQQFINFEGEDVKGFEMDVDSFPADNFNLSEPFSFKNTLSSMFDLSDITKSNYQEKKLPNGGKKLDLKAQCYVVEDIKEEVDSESETIVDIEGDFEVNINMICDFQKQNLPTNSNISNNQKIEQIPKQENFNIKQELCDDDEITFKEEIENSEANFSKTEEIKSLSIKIKSEKSSPKVIKKNNDNLPTELINKIKASNKRRSIAVIDPPPSTKRVKGKKPEEKQSQKQENKTVNISSNEENSNISGWIRLDHDYCGINSHSKKFVAFNQNQKIESDVESGEKDEQHNILKNQPTVKRADGKLMVSLLKVNTIKKMVNNSTEETQKKRKLNFEEYKKRRECFLKSSENSQNSSPFNSGRCSPVEDENVRRLKHQEKLLQMAAELLKSSPKSKQLNNPVPIPKLTENDVKSQKILSNQSNTDEIIKILDTKVTEKTDSIIKDEEVIKPIVKTNLTDPSDLISKSVVSIGVNTDLSRINSKMVLPLNISPMKQLEEIKPILKSANGKINSNSLIASVIENIQNKVKTVIDVDDVVPNPVATESVHGEDRMIIYLPRPETPVKTSDISTQTDFTNEWAIDSCRSKSRQKEKCREISTDRSSRSSSLDSRYSHVSSSSSRSRSISPKRNPVKKRSKTFDKDHLRAVEERRIVYVGRLAPRTSRDDLRRRFQKFGRISNISIHSRDYGDNYGFVTFEYNVDAYEAVEHGNDDPTLPEYDLSFGGRRIFCRTRYSDLDNIHEDLGYNPSRNSEDSFDNLLREMQAKLCKKKSTTTTTT